MNFGQAKVNISSNVFRSLGWREIGGGGGGREGEKIVEKGRRREGKERKEGGRK